MKVVSSILLAVALLPGVGCSAKTPEPDTLYVVARSGLTLRAKPSKDSQSITVLPYGSPVSILKETDIEETIENRTARWYSVQWNTEAYAFGAFLSSTQPTITVASGSSPKGTYRYVLENKGPAELVTCQNHYSATCTLRVFQGNKIVYETQGDGPVGFFSESSILLRSELGDAGLTGTSFSVLDLTSGKTSFLCSHSTSVPIGLEGKSEMSTVSYQVCDPDMVCHRLTQTAPGLFRHVRLESDGRELELENLQSPGIDLGFDGRSCWLSTGTRKIILPSRPRNGA